MSELDLLALYALGSLDDEHAAKIEAMLANDEAMRAKFEALVLELADVTATPPPVGLRARVLAVAQSPQVGDASRWLRFRDAMMRLFDVAEQRATELLAQLEQHQAWEPAAPGVRLFHFAGGPACGAADTGFVVVDPGHEFPVHFHVGEEFTIVLAGRALDSSGVVHQPGDEVYGAPQTSHSLRSVGDEPYLYAVKVSGFRLGDR